MVPAESLGALQLERMRTASAYACLNEGIVVDVFVSQLAESVTAGFVLDDSAEVKRIAVIAHRAVGYRCAVVPHIGHSSIVLGIRNHYNKAAVDVVVVYGRCLACILHDFIVVVIPITGDSSVGRCVEACVDYGIDSPDS